MWTILAVGFFDSIMFPTIFTLGEAELGALTGSGSGILNMAIVGSAILPVVQGVIADRIGLHHAFILPVLCYLYILFYALSGAEPNSERCATAQNTQTETLQTSPGPNFHGEEIRGHNQFPVPAQKSFQVVFRLRAGAGSIPCRFNISEIVLWVISCPRLDNAPWIRQ